MGAWKQQGQEKPQVGSKQVTRGAGNEVRLQLIRTQQLQQQAVGGEGGLCYSTSKQAPEPLGAICSLIGDKD
jgi:hypothetical protein